MWDPQFILGVGLVTNENRSVLHGILTSSFIIIRSGSVTAVIDFEVWKERIQEMGDWGDRPPLKPTKVSFSP